MKINRSYLKNVAINFTLFLLIAFIVGWIIFWPLTKTSILHSIVDALGFAFIFSLFTYKKNKVS